MAQDHGLQEAVIAKLAWEPSVVASHLGVAAATAWAAPGATNVINDITVT